jgi:hypothetical protein
MMPENSFFELTPKIVTEMIHRLDCPPEILNAMRESGNRQDRIWAAAHPNTYLRAVKQLAEDRDPYVASVAKRRLSLGESEWKEHWLQLHGDAYGLRAVPMRIRNHPVFRTLQVYHPDQRKRYQAALSEDTPPELLSELARDPSENIKVEICRNPNTPEEAIIYLSYSARDYVRKEALKAMQRRGLIRL